MDTSRRRFIRLAIVSATATGVALAVPVVAVADEAEVIEAAPIAENSEAPVVADLTTEPLVIELVIEGDLPTESTDMASDAPSEVPAEPDAASMATGSQPVDTDPGPRIAALDAGTDEEHADGSGEDHTGGTGGQHAGGGGTGDPYRMTFEVSWRLPDDSTIPVLDDVVPIDWRTMFDLAAASATGGGKPTSAHCTYPPGSTDLECEFENAGQHSSVTDGMIMPGKPTATYRVTVLWPISGWTIDGANDGPYSARDRCPRGGHDDDSAHGGGHESGHAEAIEADAPAGGGAVCTHTVVMRKSAVIPDPPPVEPPAQVPPVAEVPAAEPPQSPTPVPPEAAPTTPAAEVLPATATPRALPATGNTATTTLMIGTIILALGGCLSVLARRRTDLPLS